MMDPKIKVHPTADISPEAKIGSGTQIWHQAQVREHAEIGCNCIISKGVYIDVGVVIGDNVKIQNYVSIYHGAQLEDGVFIGPHVSFTNDNLPRGINPDGTLKSGEDWELGRILIKYGAALGANATVLPKVTIGRWAMAGAGAVVCHDVPDHGLVIGNPARLVDFICACGHRLLAGDVQNEHMQARCGHCDNIVEIPLILWRQVK